jgi:hypothetical protein
VGTTLTVAPLGLSFEVSTALPDLATQVLGVRTAHLNVFVKDKGPARYVGSTAAAVYGDGILLRGSGTIDGAPVDATWRVDGDRLAVFVGLATRPALELSTRLVVCRHPPILAVGALEGIVTIHAERTLAGRKWGPVGAAVDQAFAAISTGGVLGDDQLPDTANLTEAEVLRVFSVAGMLDFGVRRLARAIAEQHRFDVLDAAWAQSAGVVRDCLDVERVRLRLDHGVDCSALLAADRGDHPAWYGPNSFFGDGENLFQRTGLWERAAESFASSLSKPEFRSGYSGWALAVVANDLAVARLRMGDVNGAWDAQLHAEHLDRWSWESLLRRARFLAVLGDSARASHTISLAWGRFGASPGKPSSLSEMADASRSPDQWDQAIVGFGLSSLPFERSGDAYSRYAREVKRRQKLVPEDATSVDWHGLDDAPDFLAETEDILLAGAALLGAAAVPTLETWATKLPGRSPLLLEAHARCLGGGDALLDRAVRAGGVDSRI